MKSVEQCPCRGQPLRLFAVIGLVALAACAGPSPEIKTTAADASEPATASGATDGTAEAAAAASAGTPEDDAASSGADASDVEAAASGPAAEPPAASEPPPAPEPPPAAEPVAESETPPPEPEEDAVAETAEPAPQPAPPAVEEPPPVVAAAPSSPPGVGPPGSGLATGHPYVVIRFAEDAGDYQPALAEAVRRAVARRPNLAFDLVAVTPRASTVEQLADDKAAAQAQAAAVMKSLADLGIGPERVSMQAWTGQPTDVNEIRLYIR
jgi:outer membrane biosynthesis protein TonB